MLIEAKKICRLYVVILSVLPTTKTNLSDVFVIKKMSRHQSLRCDYVKRLTRLKNNNNIIINNNNNYHHFVLI